MNVRLSGRALERIFGSDFNDPTNERLIYLSAAGLALVGLALLVGTILWWKRGRQEHPTLAPLEVMSTRAWEKAPEGDRRRRLDQVRPAGAGATEDEIVRAEPLDLQALVRSVPQAFDDLREPGELAATEEPVAEESAVEEPVPEEPVAEVPEESVAEEPAVEEPVSEAPEEPVAEEPGEPVSEVPAEPSEQPVEAKEVADATKSDAVAPAPVHNKSVSTERPPNVVEVVSAGPNESTK